MAGMMMTEKQGVAPEADYEGEANATPEEQAAYEKFVDNGLKVISDQKMAPQILKQIADAEKPAEALATATVGVVVRLQQSAQQSGREISPDILLHGGLELMEAIAQLARAFGVHDFSEQETEAALYIAMDQYGTIEAGQGTVNKDMLAQDVQLLQQADQSGSLDQLFGSGFTEHAKGLGAAPKEQEGA